MDLSCDSIKALRKSALDNLGDLFKKMGWEIGVLVLELLNTRHGVENLDVNIVDRLNMRALEMAFAILFDLEKLMKDDTLEARLYLHPTARLIPGCHNK